MTDLLIQWHETFMDTDRIPTIIFAIMLCAGVGMITGPLAGNAHPFFWRILDILFGNTGEKLDKAGRPKADLMFRGFLVGVFVVLMSALFAKVFMALLMVETAFGVTRVVLLGTLMTSGAVWFALLKLYFAMDQNKVGQGAYYAIARTTRTNLSANDDYGITRTAMTLSAKSFDKGIVAPALWYLIGGFPLACVYAGLAFAQWRFGKNGLGSGFAAVPLALERLMGFIPSLFSGVLITLAAMFTPTARLHKGVAAWMGHKNRAPYEQGGPPLSSLAWGLNISLGGAVQDISGLALKGVWVGPEGATAQLNHKHLRRAIYINVIAHILFIAALLGAYTWGSLSISADLSTFTLDF